MLRWVNGNTCGDGKGMVKWTWGDGKVEKVGKTDR